MLTRLTAAGRLDAGRKVRESNGQFRPNEQTGRRNPTIRADGRQEKATFLFFFLFLGGLIFYGCEQK
jgi:hypothetical protein